MRGLMELREMELKETHRIIFTIKNASNRVGCSSKGCSSRRFEGPLDAEITGAHQRGITESADGGMRSLQALSASEFVEDTGSKFCQVCLEKIQAAHVEVRRKAWAALPEVFGLKA